MQTHNGTEKRFVPSVGRWCLNATCALAVSLGTTLPNAAILSERASLAWADEPVALAGARTAADAADSAADDASDVVSADDANDPAPSETEDVGAEVADAISTGVASDPASAGAAPNAGDSAIAEAASDADDSASPEAVPADDVNATLSTAAADDESLAVSQTFAAGGLTYRVTATASDDQPGAVQLTRVDASLSGALAVPASVSPEGSKLSYKVTSVQFAAFANRSALTSVSLPASITSYQYYFVNSADACFYRCAALESVSVEDGCPCLMSVDGVLFARDEAGDPVALLAYPQAKPGASFEVPGSVHTVAGYAFAGNTSLKTVAFASGLEGDAGAFASAGALEGTYVGGIGASAFEGCTALEGVTFPDDAVLATCAASVTSAIGTHAFKGCTALKSIVVPAIRTAERKASAYADFDELNPESNLLYSTDEVFSSGYSPYWHNANGPVARPGIGEGAFSGCSSLESIVFAAGGNPNGAFAYWTGSKTMFEGCSVLEALVFEDAQPYWGNPNASMRNGAYSDLWTTSAGDTIAEPTYYYAVDYYATTADAAGTDLDSNKRLARVEFARGTSTSDIATSAESLDSATADRDLYALSDEDGIVPDPSEVARKAGLGDGTWVWTLDGTQSKRPGLTESCRAYLAKADNISNGRFDLTEIEALYRQTDRNLSEGTVNGTAFDPRRFVEDTSYSVEPLDGESSPWATYNAATGEIGDGIAVRAADGTELEADSYTLSFERYDAQSDSFVEAQPGDEADAYLVTATPTAESGYTGMLRDWILLEKHSGTVSENFGNSAADAADAARYPYSQVTSLDYSDAPYSVTVGGNDVIGALVASGYAGLVQGAINVDNSQSETFGMALNPSSYANGAVRDASQSITYTRTGSDGQALSASSYANAVYLAVENRRARLGIPAATYPWGDTALLVPAASADDLAAVAAYAYANKAPVFFTEDDGTVSSVTQGLIKGFDKVVVVGNEKQFSTGAFKALTKSLAADAKVVRLGDGATGVAEFSLDVAQALVDAGKASYSDIAISDGANPVTCIASLNYVGKVGGITLASKSTSDSVAIAQALHDRSAEVNAVALYGPASGDNAVALASDAYEGNAFGALWEDDDAFARIMAAVTGDVDEYATDSGTQPGADDGGAVQPSSPSSGTSDDDAPDDNQEGSSRDADGADDGQTPAMPAPTESENVTANVIDTVEEALALQNDFASLPKSSGSLAVLNPVQTIIGAAASTVASGQLAEAADAEALLLGDGETTDLPSAIDAAQKRMEQAAEDGETDGTSLPARRAPFLITLAALCSAGVPILRRIK